MPVIYVRYQLDTNFVGTNNVEYCRYVFPDDWTQKQIEDYIWDEYSESQMTHYESYSDFWNYCVEQYDIEINDGNEDYVYDEYWDEYASFVLEQGSYEILDHKPTEDEMSDSSCPMNHFDIRG